MTVRYEYIYRAIPKNKAENHWKIEFADECHKLCVSNTVDITKAMIQCEV